MWSNKCACDLCYFYGLMTQGDGRGKFNGNRVALTPLMMVKKAWGSTSPSLHWHMGVALLDGRERWQMD